MSKRWLINYLLIVLIVIFTWIGTKYPIRDDQKIDRATITGLQAQSINHIKIQTADGSLTMQRIGGSWMLTTPIQWYANNLAAERVAAMAEIKPESSLPRSEIDLAELGLVMPKAVLTLDSQSILFGDTNRIGSRRYLLADPKVYLADDIYFPFINQGIGAFIDNRLLPPNEQLSALKTSSFTLSREGEQWLSSNASHSADSLQQLATNWQSMSADRISRYQKSGMPLQKITAKLGFDTQIEFYVIAIKPEIIIARPDLGVQYHFADFHYYGLLQPAKPDE